jgi:hypothetical protein
MLLTKRKSELGCWGGKCVSGIPRAEINHIFFRNLK